MIDLPINVREPIAYLVDLYPSQDGAQLENGASRLDLTAHGCSMDSATPVCCMPVSPRFKTRMYSFGLLCQ